MSMKGTTLRARRREMSSRPKPGVGILGGWTPGDSRDRRSLSRKVRTKDSPFCRPGRHARLLLERAAQPVVQLLGPEARETPRRALLLPAAVPQARHALEAARVREARLALIAALVEEALRLRLHRPALRRELLEPRARVRLRPDRRPHSANAQPHAHGHRRKGLRETRRRRDPSQLMAGPRRPRNLQPLDARRTHQCRDHSATTCHCHAQE